MPKFVQEGCAVDFIAPTDLPAGAVVVQGDLVGVNSRALAAGEAGSLAVEGVFDFPKTAAAATGAAAGARFFWDPLALVATYSDGGGANKFIGKNVKDTLDTDETVRLRLSQ